MLKKIIPLALLSFTIACNNGDKNNDTATTENTATVPAPAAISYSVMNAFPHDTTAFTQGLEIYNNELYEGTGEYGESTLRKVDLKTGKVLKQISIDSTYFGEGITIFNNKLYELTWQNHIVLEYDLNFNLLKKINIPYDGWGLTHDAQHLILSDGSSNIYFLQPETLKTLKTINVADNYGMLNNLNELEYINGFIYANVWQTDNIVKIDPATGNIVGKIELPDLLKKNGKEIHNQDFVLNGIAYDSTTKKTYITGKSWPLLFEVKFN